MINIIWAFFIILSIVYAIINNDLSVINKTILESGKKGLDILIQMLPVMAIWLGLMGIANESGLLKKLSKMLTPFLRKIFPEIPKNHESLGYIASNIVINMFGLGSAATPFGLKAMKSLQEVNNKKDTASRSMITFLVLNTSGMTIIPTTIISLRMLYGSLEPTKIVLACILATLSSTVFGLLMDFFMARRSK